MAVYDSCISGDVVVRFVYTCDDCHKQKAGDRIPVRVLGTSAERFAEHALRHVDSRTKELAFPVGWSNSASGLRCDMCTPQD